MNVERESSREKRPLPGEAESSAARAVSASAARSEPGDAAPRAEALPATRTGGRKLIAVAVLLVLAVAGLTYFLYSRQFEETDDAQVDGNISNVSPRVSGTIKAVHVIDNQLVNVGDLLAEIDTSDLEVAAAEARAAVAQAEAQLKAEDPNVSITETSNTASLASATQDIASATASLAGARKNVAQLTAQLAEAEANNRTTQLERARSERLIAQGAIAQAEFDDRTNAAAAAAANVDALKQALDGAKDQVEAQQAHVATSQTHLVEVRSNAPRQVETRRASVGWRQASLDLAKAQLAQADLNVSHAKVLAPVTGIVGKKSVNVGDHVAPGQELMAISETMNLWITANYRETQLERVHSGQGVDVHVDAIAADLRGTVESIGGATGARFSVLPPENASGNYVKVVQRIPVRIKLDPGQPGLDRLRPGMSVEPKVRVR